MDVSINDFIENIPKAELHLHIEGSFEPELMLEIADRNKIKTKFSNVEQLKSAYNFENLQEFLDIYYEGAKVLITEQDFFDLGFSYFTRINKMNVHHAEIMFDPQTHTNRSINFETVLNGLKEAQRKAEIEYGISSKLILNFLRHLSEKEAFETLKAAVNYKELISAIGLDSSELGNPPSKFKDVFTLARNEGFKVIAHAGEEAPANYIWEALNLLKVERIDHGISSIDDLELLDYLKQTQIPLTVCPLSNIKLKNIDIMENHPIKKLLDYGLLVTVNSDDPAYFGGYLNENFLSIYDSLNLNESDICTFAKNSFKASFLNENDKQKNITKIDDFMKKCGLT